MASNEGSKMKRIDKKVWVQGEVQVEDQVWTHVWTHVFAQVCTKIEDEMWISVRVRVGNLL